MKSAASAKCTSNGTTPSEKTLRTIWRSQNFRQNGLRTPDGRSLTILSPGTQNDDGGPDFTGACIRIGSTTFAGDVELHLTPPSWFSHRHHTDSHYNRVILHVVLDANDATPAARTASNRLVPLLVLRPYLNATASVSPSHSTPGAAECRQTPIRCAPFNSQIPAQTIIEWIRELAVRRIRNVVNRMAERIYELIDTDDRRTREPFHVYHGRLDDIPTPSRTYNRTLLSQPWIWDQILYEGIMEGMGFTKNRSPFQMLAASLPLDLLRRYSLTDLDTQAALMFGVAGLLPSSRGLPDPLSRKEVRRLRKRWRELRNSLHRPLLHEAEWLFFRLRPANFPTARLATMCHLLPNLFQPGMGFQMFLQHIRNRDASPALQIRQMRELLKIEPAGFWQTHTHFRGTHALRGIALGVTRKNEILVNAVVPLLLLRAKLFGEKDLENNAMNMLEIIPRSHSRAIQTMIALLVRDRFPIKSAFAEQGMLECYNRYCMRGMCKECAVGVAVGRLVCSTP